MTQKDPRIPRHLTPERVNLLRSRLDLTEGRFRRTMEIQNDPISLVLGYRDPADLEVASFIAAVFSYGNVKQIQATLSRVFSYLGPSPSKTLKTSDGPYWQRVIPEDFRHRFNNSRDLGLLLTWLGEVLRQSGSLKQFFYEGFKNTSALDDIGPVLENFIDRFCKLPSGPYKVPKSKGALFFLPRPSGKSACKRLLLFLRWVAGHGPMDLNLWNDFPREILLIPVDTHVLRISRHLGLTKRKDNSWRTAVEITRNLRLLDPEDPTRFDFALCHMGISKECPSRYDLKICERCEMNSLCLTYKRRAKRR